MPNSDSTTGYKLPDDYFRSERVFRVARATQNLYRQMRALECPIDPASLRFESAVISDASVKKEDTAVNYTTYKLLESLEVPQQKELLESIPKLALYHFLDEVAQKYCDPNNIAQLRDVFAKEPTFSTAEEIKSAYTQLVALYSRIPVRGYVAQLLNKHHFGDEAAAPFFLVHAAPQVGGLPLISIWAASSMAREAILTTSHNATQATDASLGGFFIDHLLRVVRNQELITERNAQYSPGKEYHFVAIPLHTLHPFPIKCGAGTFLGWLFVHCKPWEHASTITIDYSILTSVKNLWPLLDDYASSLLDGEIEERLAIFGRAITQNPLRFVKDQVSLLSGWKCGADPTPEEVRDISHFRRTDNNTLVMVLAPAQAGKAATAIRLIPKESTILPENSQLQNYGASRFFQRIRSFYEQAHLRASERRAANLAGQNKVSHSLPYAITLCLGTLRDYADAAAEMRQIPLPITSAAQIPRAIREFSYPAGLYSTGVEYALLQPKESDAFNRLIPQVEWIDDALRTDGLNALCLEEIARKIAWPLARFSLLRARKFRLDHAMPKLSVSGAISAAVLGFADNIMPRIFMAAIVECFREAFHHADGEQPLVHVVLSESPDCRLEFSNSCALLEVPSALLSGNQRAMLNQLQSHLDGWTISSPQIIKGYWRRIIIKSTP